MEAFDVVIVGAGIAGSTLGSVLAPRGVSVLLLERQIEYRDKVRGEFMAPWGVAEALRLGLERVLLDAGGAYSTTLVGYDEDVEPAASERAPIPFGQFIEGVRGALCVGHPQASAALRSLAENGGVTLRVGVGDVEVTAGARPTVRYELDDECFEASCRLVVGADGRQSSVRRGVGIALHQTTSKAMLGGLLVRTSDWPRDWSVASSEGDAYHLAFPRADGYVRLYLACEPGTRSKGAERGRLLLGSFSSSAMPFSAAVRSCEVAGPCAYVQGSDGWANSPVVEGVVLVGDAAGWSDPIIGQGLSVAMRDARMVSDILLEADDWSPNAFERYVTERAERMSRLKVAGYVTTEIRCTSTPDGRARRAALRADASINPLTRAPLLGSVAGPETQPAEAYEEENVRRILNLK